MTDGVSRIAMWSGPRNLSTAMMRSFGARSDCAVWDEPFYAAYLVQSGIDHPMRAESIAAGETDPDKVAARCLGPAPDGRPVFYQKHMTHHMLPGIDRSFMAKVTNVFLIRAPEHVVASYLAKRENPTVDDLGYERQLALFDAAAELQGSQPVVIDATDVRAEPRRVLTALCRRIGLSFDEAMLSWPAGPNKDDGAWAPHWYQSVWASTGFAPPETGTPDLTEEGKCLADAARPFYDKMKALAL